MENQNLIIGGLIVFIIIVIVVIYNMYGDDEPDSIPDPPRIIGNGNGN